MFNPAAEVLLQQMQGDIGHYWIVPGGGLAAGESYEAAAVRELAEEVGHQIAELGPWVWSRTANFTFRGTHYLQRERFYIAWAEIFNFDHSGQEEIEREIVLGHRWWAIDEIAAAVGETFFPNGLAALLEPLARGELPATPLTID